MPRGGNQPLVTFEEILGFPAGFSARAAAVDALRAEAVAAIHWLESSRPPRQGSWPALCLALVAQVEETLRLLGRDSDDDIIAGRAALTTASGGPARQLILRTGSAEVPTRRYYNAADAVIRINMNREHPSMPGHATAGWSGYQEFIKRVGRCSPNGRAAVAEWIWIHGVLPLSERMVPTRRTRRPRPFFEVVKSLDTTSGTTGGAMYQAMVYAYFVADSPTLTVVSHKVNVGSSRAGALGDVDGFLGEEIVLAAEAKDKDLTIDDEDDLAGFIEDVAPHPDVDAVIFANTFDQEIRAVLDAAEIRTVTRQQMLESIALWDVPKQENAIRAMRFFLANIQKSQPLLQRLTTFLATIQTLEPTGLDPD